MGKNILGIEIGNKRMKIAEFRGGELQDFFTVDIPENMVVDDELIAFEAMGDLLRETVRENRIRTKKCALVLPDADLYLRSMTMPAMTEKQLLVNMPYEFKDILADDKDKYLYDYSLISLDKDENGTVKEMRLLGAVVRKDLIEKYKEMFRRASLKLIKAAPRETVMSTLIKELQGGEHKGDFAILDLGWRTTRVDIFKDGAYEVTRTIETGAEQIIRAVAELKGVDPHAAVSYMVQNKDNIQEHESLVDIYSSIAVEVMRAMNYYAFENPESTLNTLYYCGGAGSIPRFIREIQDMLDLKLIPLSDLSNEDKEAVMNGSAAVGICL